MIKTRRHYELMAGSKWIYLSSCVALYSHATELACVSEYLYLVWILWFSHVGTSSMYHVLGHRISTWESIIDVLLLEVVTSGILVMFLYASPS